MHFVGNLTPVHRRRWRGAPSRLRAWAQRFRCRRGTWGTRTPPSLPTGTGCWTWRRAARPVAAQTCGGCLVIIRLQHMPALVLTPRMPTRSGFRPFPACGYRCLDSVAVVDVPAGEQRQARGGCLADLVFTGEEAGDQPGSHKYTFATAASLRADSTQPASQSLQQASSCRQHRAHCSQPGVAGLVFCVLSFRAATLETCHAAEGRHQSLADESAAVDPGGLHRR